MGSVCGQFRFAGRFDPIETKSFGLIRKFRSGVSIQMANFQARDFDRNCVAIGGSLLVRIAGLRVGSGFVLRLRTETSQVHQVLWDVLGQASWV